MQDCQSQHNRHLIIAVDESESSERAVKYVAYLAGGLPGFRVTVFNLVADPGEDFFESDDERADWIRQAEQRAAELLEKYRVMLISGGFEPSDVSVDTRTKTFTSLAESIFEEAERVSASTVVLGRKEKPRQMEFLFGSTTDRLVRQARNCAIWIVE